MKTPRGSGFKTRLLNPIDEFWDRRFGVHTVGYIPDVGQVGAPDWRCAYVPTKYRRIIASLRHISIGPDDVFVDLGCGLGRAVFAASWLGAKRAIGIEIDSGLAAQAQSSLQRSRINTGRVEFQCAAAENVSPTDVTVLFMFNPFGAGTMQAVINHLDAEIAQRPRNLRLVYENPLQAAVVDASPHLQRFDEWPGGKHGSQHPVIFWNATNTGL